VLINPVKRALQSGQASVGTWLSLGSITAARFMARAGFAWLTVDLEHRVLYWTDRGDPPRGNTVNRAPLDGAKPGAPEIVLTHLMEGIGLALDVPHDRMFVTDFGGSVYSARLDGSEKRTLLAAQGNLTGIAYAE